MERLTKRHSPSSVTINPHVSEDVYLKLADYEDAEEQGLLYMKVYVLEDFCHKPRDCEGDCEFCSSNEPCIDSEYIPYSEFDKTKHFKTREEAEQALKQMGE